MRRHCHYRNAPEFDGTSFELDAYVHVVLLTTTLQASGRRPARGRMSW